MRHAPLRNAANISGVPGALNGKDVAEALAGLLAADVNHLR